MGRLSLAISLVLVLAVSGGAAAGCVGSLSNGSPVPRTDADSPGSDGGVMVPPPDDAGSVSDAGPMVMGDMCGDERIATAIYFGTREPTYLPLSPNQILAVGAWGGCSGLLIAPTWVLTAEHCGVGRGSTFCMGLDPEDADVCFEVRNAYDAPGGGDMTLAEIDDVRDRLPEVVPIPILTEDMDDSWIGRTAEAAGYGQQEDGGFNEREFTAEPIVSMRGDDLTIDGEGRHGVCFGDSGGPVMVIASDGTVRTAGALSNGDTSCTGRDNYTRVDLYRTWIESHTGPTVVDGAPCGEVTGEGRCMDGVALFCAGDELRSERCGGSCGWDASASGFRCIESVDPCDGVDAFGACDGEVARWCDRGVLRRRDCGLCSQQCTNVAEVGGIYCADAPEDPCMGVDYQGRCNGDVVEYCKDGEYRTRDCASEGQSCGWVSEDLGYWCE